MRVQDGKGKDILCERSEKTSVTLAVSQRWICRQRTKALLTRLEALWLTGLDFKNLMLREQVSKWRQEQRALSLCKQNDWRANAARESSVSAG